MVNTGKPSRGCYMCRARRIKCDEGKPGCMRCQKSKRVCPGYRDAFELKLRDESKSTKKRLNRRTSQDQSGPSNVVHGTDSSHGAFPEMSPSFLVPSSSTVPRARQTSTSSSGVSPTFPASHSRHGSVSSISSQGSIDPQNAMAHFHKHHNLSAGHMTTPLSQQASCYFLSNFVLVPEAGTMRGYLDFVIPLLKQRNPPQSLVLAFSAVTLAALGTRPNSKTLLPTADLWYLKALKEINSALQDPKVASSDSTLASVMLMASFEQLTPSRMKVRGWSSHIDGAVAVMKSRTKEQWQTSVGKELFIAVRAHMTLHCIASSKPVNPNVDWTSVTADDPIVQSFAEANLKMAQLRADNDVITVGKLRTPENIENVLSLLQRAQDLDQQYIDWLEALPLAWQIRTVAWIDGEVPDLANSVVHPGRIDAYGELWMAYKYNVVRGCRLFTWTTILRCLAWLNTQGDYRLMPEYTSAARTCSLLIEDIVASVPYFFGWNRGRDPAMADRSNFACGAVDPTSVKPLTGIFAMWPLYAAATSDFASPSQRIFLRGRLKTIAEAMGINQAVIMLKSPLVHPSLYIARERMSVLPSNSGFPSNATQLPIIPSVTSPPMFSPPPPPTPTVILQQQPTWSTSPVLDQRWASSPESAVSAPNCVPRIFTETPYLHDTTGYQTIQGPPSVRHSQSPPLSEREYQAMSQVPLDHRQSQSPSEADRSYQPYQYAGFGAVGSS